MEMQLCAFPTSDFQLPGYLPTCRPDNSTNLALSCGITDKRLSKKPPASVFRDLSAVLLPFTAFTETPIHPMPERSRKRHRTAVSFILNCTCLVYQRSPPLSSDIYSPAHKIPYPDLFFYFKMHCTNLAKKCNFFTFPQTPSPCVEADANWS